MSGICYKPAEIYLGIDLGTTNSCACLSTDGFRQNVVDFHGSSLLPSYAQFKRGKPIVIGNMAKKSASNKKASVVYNTKRAMGRSFNDPEVQKMKDNFGSPIINKDGYPYFQISATGELQSPTDIGTKIVQHIIERANEKSDSKVTHVCITVPAYFDENQRSATLQCVLNCGFTADQVEILNEPTAAAIRYISENNFQDGYLLVYDLGGGTFDVSIVEVRNNECTVKSYAGDNCLGGSDFDKAVADLICSAYDMVYECGLLPKKDDQTYQRCYSKLLQIAEITKIDLSSESLVSVDLSIFGGLGRDDDKENQIVITRDQLNNAIRPYIMKTMNIIDEALSKARLRKEDISQVIRVGGSSRLLIVEEELTKYFDREGISTGVNMDTCVAEGACRSLHDEQFKINEITAYSLGHLLHDGTIHCVIPAGSRIPTHETVTNYTTENNQRDVKTALYQGHATRTNEQTPVNECIKLSDFSYYGFEQLPAGEVQFETTYFIEKSGIVYVTVIEYKTGKTLLDRHPMEYDP